MFSDPRFLQPVFPWDVSRRAMLLHGACTDEFFAKGGAGSLDLLRKSARFWKRRKKRPVDMDQRLSFVTIAVDDFSLELTFYELPSKKETGHRHNAHACPPD